MSTATPTELGTVTLFGRACAAEWLRLRTVRTTWWCLLAAAVTIIGIGTAAGIDEGSGDVSYAPPPAWEAGEIAVLPGQFALLVLALLAVTPEYGSRAIGTTLQWTPRRGVLVAARMLVPVAVATGAGVVLTLAADLAAWTAFPSLELTVAGLADSLGWVAVVLAAGSLLAVGLGFALRSTAGALTCVFLLMLVLPTLLPAFGLDWMDTLGELLPGSGAIFLLLGEPSMSTPRALAVLLGWSAAAAVAGALSLLRRDAG